MKFLPLRIPNLAAFLYRRPAAKVQRTLIVAGTILALVLLTTNFIRPLPLVQLEALGYDLQLHALHRSSPPSRVVIVDIDEKSLRRVGQWPWPRYKIARLLDVIQLSGAQATGIDFVFSESDRLSLRNLQIQMEKDLNVSVSLEGIPEAYLDNDAVLARTLSQPGIVTGIWFDFIRGMRSKPPLLTPYAQVRFSKAPDGHISLPNAADILLPAPALLSKVQSVGFLNSLPDADGKIRRVPLLIHYADNYYPSLALATVMRVLNSSQVVGTVTSAGIEDVRVGGIRIPTDHAGNMLIPFSGNSRTQFERFSAVDILLGKIPRERLKGKVVFVGSSATAQNDAHPTALDRQLPGVLIHGIAADAMLRNDFIVSPSWTQGAHFIEIAFCCGLVVFALTRFKLAVSTLICVAGSVGVICGTQWLFSRHGIFLSPVPSLLSLGSSFMMLGVIRFRSEEKEAILRSQELSLVQQCAIISLVSLVETRDSETGYHIVRTQNYVRILAEQLAKHPEYKKTLTPEVIETAYISAPLHDIGKVGVPDHILLKPGPLTDDEFAIMRQHTVIGQRTLQHAVSLSGLDSQKSFLHCAEEVAAAHHERWDGKGYPNGLSGRAIPLAARLMALADVYDAMRSKRCYQEPMNHVAVVEKIRVGSGTLFDPDAVQAFLEIEADFLMISEKYLDTDH